MSEMIEISHGQYTGASLPELVEEIRSRYAASEEAYRSSLSNAVACGMALIAAKTLVGHGLWIPWLAENFPGNRTTAADFMRLAKNAHRLDGVSSIRGALRAIPKENVAQCATFENPGTTGRPEPKVAAAQQDTSRETLGTERPAGAQTAEILRLEEQNRRLLADLAAASAEIERLRIQAPVPVQPAAPSLTEDQEPIDQACKLMSDLVVRFNGNEIKAIGIVQDSVSKVFSKETLEVARLASDVPISRCAADESQTVSEVVDGVPFESMDTDEVLVSEVDAVNGVAAALKLVDKIKRRLPDHMLPTFAAKVRRGLVEQFVADTSVPVKTYMPDLYLDHRGVAVFLKELRHRLPVSEIEKKHLSRRVADKEQTMALIRELRQFAGRLEDRADLAVRTDKLFGRFPDKLDDDGFREVWRTFTNHIRLQGGVITEDWESYRLNALAKVGLAEAKKSVTDALAKNRSTLAHVDYRPGSKPGEKFDPNANADRFSDDIEARIREKRRLKGIT